MTDLFCYNCVLKVVVSHKGVWSGRNVLRVVQDSGKVGSHSDRCVTSGEWAEKLKQESWSVIFANPHNYRYNFKYLTCRQRQGGSLYISGLPIASEGHLLSSLLSLIYLAVDRFLKFMFIL